MRAYRDLVREQAAANQSRFIFNHVKQWDGIRVQHCRLPSGSATRHSSREHQIIIPLEGSFVSELHSATGNNRVGSVTVGGTPILPAGQPYCAHWEDEIEDISLFLDPSLLARAAADSDMTSRIELIEACGTSDPIIRQIAMALAAEAGSERPASRLYAESLANLLAVHLLRHYTIAGYRLRVVTGGLSGRKLRRATEFIADNLEHDIALREIAGAVDLSPYHFARAFKQATGLTPHQYLIKSRIERAKSLLAETELPIIEISHGVGFKNQSHFTTIFRRLTSLTPGAYRDTLRR
jgi:AraC family transcriptional regulator